MICLTKAQILAMHGELISETGGSKEVRDEGLLESAINAPFQSFGGKDIYPTLKHKAARLGFGLARNHAFVDGNKRIGAHAMLVFLALNGVELEYTQEELSSLFLGIATSDVSCEELTEWIARHEHD